MSVASNQDANRKDAALEITLPDDLAGSHALIEQLAFAIDSKSQENEALRREYQDLQLAFERFLRKRRERYIADPNQLPLDLGAGDAVDDAKEGLDEAIEEAESQVRPHTRRRRKPRNEQLPEHLPRREVEASVPDDVKCCPHHGIRQLIGYDPVETLHLKKPELFVLVTKYPKYACCRHPECGVASPERPTGLVEGNRYDTSVAAEIVTAKYGYHLPVYRQQDLFAGSGWTPGRSTLLNIMKAAAFAIEPLVAYLKRVVLAGGLLGTDDTTVTLVLPPALPDVDPSDPKSQRIHDVFSEAYAKDRKSVTARMWAYRGLVVPLNVFDFTVSRHRDGPADVLTDFKGVLLADCYAGYEGIAVRSDGDILRAACGGHARRHVFNAQEVYPIEAGTMLARFQQLYDIEDQAKMMSVSERTDLRQQLAAPVWDAMGEWLKSDAATRVVPKSKLGKALNYMRNHWEPLQVYLGDGRIPMDNNETEQLMKQIAVGRKNWLFIGSVAAGVRAAGFMTLMSSALRNHLDVWEYFKDILDRLLAGETNYEALRPDVWAIEHPEAIRQYRAEERRDRADRKQVQRALRRRQKQQAPQITG